MFTHSRTEESARRPSADFVARFREQHFSPENHSEELVKQESDYHDMEHLNHSMFDLDPTPKASGVHFRFTPSLLDPNSSPFAAFAAQPPGYYTPTPGGSTLGFQTYEMAANTPTFKAPDSLSHPYPNAMATPSIFQPQLHNLDQSNYMHFRPHPYSQDCYQGLSIPGSVVGGAGS